MGFLPEEGEGGQAGGGNVAEGPSVLAHGRSDGAKDHRTVQGVTFETDVRGRRYLKLPRWESPEAHGFVYSARTRFSRRPIGGAPPASNVSWNSRNVASGWAAKNFSRIWRMKSLPRV